MDSTGDVAVVGANKDIVNKTPFGARKSANQTVQWSIDPSKGLSKIRQIWYSNGTLHDNSLFSEDPGEITISTTATTSDVARLHSALQASMFHML